MRKPEEIRESLAEVDEAVGPILKDLRAATVEGFEPDKLNQWADIMGGWLDRLAELAGSARETWRTQEVNRKRAWAACFQAAMDSGEKVTASERVANTAKAVLDAMEAEAVAEGLSRTLDLKFTAIHEAVMVVKKSQTSANTRETVR